MKLKNEKTIEELCEEMNEAVDDVEIGIDQAADMGIVHKIEMIGMAIKLATSTAEERLTIILFPRQRTISPVPVMLIVGAEEMVRRREAAAVEERTGTSDYDDKDIKCATIAITTH
uniref:Uncharacterized protein n=1 Tax=Glossina austeni TaxID=7395 RepID=A0A1A9UI63_GLOAU